MKKKLTVLLSLLMVFSVSGCGEKKNEQERETIKWAGVPSVTVLKDSETECWLEEKYNIDIEIMNTDSDEKLSAMIASGNIPDVMFLREPEIWIPLARQNILAPLTVEQVKSNAPRYSSALDSREKNLWMSGMDGGQLWALPQIMGNEYIHIGIIREDWLEKVGISALPRTLAEYEEVFERFTNGDPDGNGQNDTYGMTGMGGHQERQFDSIFGAFGVMPGQWRVSADGRVALDTVSPKAREALRLLHRWYESGYIHPECVTDSVDSAAAKFTNGMVGVTFDNGNLYVANTLNGQRNLRHLQKSDPNAALCFAYPPEGEDGSRGSFLWGPRANFLGFGKQMSDKPKTLNKILNILDDLCYDEELWVRERWGVLGKHYEYIDPTIGESSGRMYIAPYTDAGERKKAGLGGFFNLLKGTPAEEQIISSTEHYDLFTIEEENCEDALLRMFLPSKLELQEKLDHYKSVSYSKFITGERSLEEWDSFVTEFMNMGGAQLTKEAQELYEEYFAE